VKAGILAAVATVLAVAFVPDASAAGAQVRVSATILPRATLTAVSQVPVVTVTARDIERGFVEVASATRFELTSNTSSQLEVTGSGEWFRAVRVTGLPSAALEFTSMARAIAQLPAFINRYAADLSVRFDLAPGARPGAYAWPLALSVTPW
jgi:hypothetical protein